MLTHKQMVRKMLNASPLGERSSHDAQALRTLSRLLDDGDLGVVVGVLWVWRSVGADSVAGLDPGPGHLKDAGTTDKTPAVARLESGGGSKRHSAV